MSGVIHQNMWAQPKPRFGAVDVVLLVGVGVVPAVVGHPADRPALGGAAADRPSGRIRATSAGSRSCGGSGAGGRSCRCRSRRSASAGTRRRPGPARRSRPGRTPAGPRRGGADPDQGRPGDAGRLRVGVVVVVVMLNLVARGIRAGASTRRLVTSRPCGRSDRSGPDSPITAYRDRGPGPDRHPDSIGRPTRPDRSPDSGNSDGMPGGVTQSGGTSGSRRPRVYNDPTGHAKPILAKIARRVRVDESSPDLGESRTMRGVYCDGSSIRLRRDLPEPEPGRGRGRPPRPGRRHLRHRPATRPGLHGLPGRPRPRVRRPDRRRPPGHRRDQQRLPRIARPAAPAGPTIARTGPSGHPRTTTGRWPTGSASPRATCTTSPTRSTTARPSSSSPWPPPSGSPSRSTLGPGRRRWRSSATASSASSAPGSPG